MISYGSSGKSFTLKFERLSTPDIALVGAPRCGTTSISFALSQHPEICVASPKEPFFFERDFYMGKKWYEETFFPNSNAFQFKLDARAFNFWIKYCAARMHLSNPEMQIIIVLRDPIEQIYSMWNHMYRMRPGRCRNFTEEFERASESYHPFNFQYEEEVVPFLDGKGGFYKPFFFECASYGSNIARFKELFGSNVHLFLFDDLKEDSNAFMRKMELSLGIEIDRSGGVGLLNEGAYRAEAIAIQEMFPSEVYRIKVSLRSEIIQASEFIGVDLYEKWGWSN